MEAYPNCSTKFGFITRWPSDPSMSPVIPNQQSHGDVPLTDAQEQHRINSLYWLHEYSEDIFQTLRSCELHIPLVEFRSYQSTRHRHNLIHLMKTCADGYMLSRTTMHLAVYLLDRFMDKYNVREYNLNLIALTCLIVAAKVEETDAKVPKFTDLQEVVLEEYNLTDFKNQELKMLRLFKFELIRPTAATFAEYFISGFLTFADFLKYRRNWLQVAPRNTDPPCCCCAVRPLRCYNTFKEMLEDLGKLLLDFVDVSLHYISFTNVRPSVLAAACIAAVRQVSCIWPIWTSHLVELTDCTHDVVAPFIAPLMVLWQIQTGQWHGGSSVLLLPTSIGTDISMLCDSPDSGIVLENDTKSDVQTDDNDDDDDDNDNDDDFANTTKDSVLDDDRKAKMCKYINKEVMNQDLENALNECHEQTENYNRTAIKRRASTSELATSTKNTKHDDNRDYCSDCVFLNKRPRLT